jgi:hypothetical protein
MWIGVTAVRCWTRIAPVEAAQRQKKQLGRLGLPERLQQLLEREQKQNLPSTVVARVSVPLAGALVGARLVWERMVEA